MRKFLISAATFAALAALPTAALAQASTATGAAVGAGTGFAIGGPPGAVIGGVIGGSVGAAHEPRPYPHAYGYYQPERVCWKDRRGRTLCEYR